VSDKWGAACIPSACRPSDKSGVLRNVWVQVPPGWVVSCKHTKDAKAKKKRVAFTFPWVGGETLQVSGAVQITVMRRLDLDQNGAPERPKAKPEVLATGDEVEIAKHLEATSTLAMLHDARAAMSMDLQRIREASSKRPLSFEESRKLVSYVGALEKATSTETAAKEVDAKAEGEKSLSPQEIENVLKALRE